LEELRRSQAAEAQQAAADRRSLEAEAAKALTRQAAEAEAAQSVLRQEAAEALRQAREEHQRHVAEVGRGQEPSGENHALTRARCILRCGQEDARHRHALRAVQLQLEELQLRARTEARHDSHERDRLAQEVRRRGNRPDRRPRPDWRPRPATPHCRGCALQVEQLRRQLEAVQHDLQAEKLRALEQLRAELRAEAAQREQDMARRQEEQLAALQLQHTAATAAMTLEHQKLCERLTLGALRLPGSLGPGGRPWLMMGVVGEQERKPKSPTPWPRQKRRTASGWRRRKQPFGDAGSRKRHRRWNPAKPTQRGTERA
jgi:hypothetical protein